MIQWDLINMDLLFDIYLNMSNVQYKDLWWESHDSQSYSMRVFLGLGRNPAE